MAVCRHEGGDVRVFLIQGNPGSRSLVDRFECRSNELSDRLTAASCGRVLVILPSSTTLVRTIHVPPGNLIQVESTIRVEADARLLGSAPDHRTGLAMIGRSGPHPTGLVVAWPEALDPGMAALTNDLEVTWVPEIACLAFLAGDTPVEISAVLDQGGSTTAVIPTSNGPVFRSSRGNPDEDPETRLRPMVVETLLTEGLEPTLVEAELDRLLQGTSARLIGESLLMETGAEGRIAGMIAEPPPPADGRNACADRLLLAALGVADGSMSDLAKLRQFEFREKPGFIGAVSGRLSHGRTAVAIAFATILVLVFSPLAFAGVRLMVMRGKVADLKELEAQVLEVENLGKVYRELDKQAWSITKLLGDISNLMPKQIELISISLAHGEPLSVAGVAKRDGDLSGRDIVFMFDRELRESGLFADVGPLPSIEQPDGRGYTEFKITAELSNPLRQLRPRPEDDYAVLTYRDRRYGPVDDDGFLILDPEDRQARIDALLARGVSLDKPLPATKASVDPNSSAVDASNSSSREDESSSTASRPPRGADNDREIASSAGTEEAAEQETRSQSRGSTASRSRGASPRSSGEAPASRNSIRNKVIDIPEPLAPEEIDAMTVPEAKDRLGKVSRARQAAGIDDEQKARLKDEFNALMQRIRKGD